MFNRRRFRYSQTRDRSSVNSRTVVGRLLHALLFCSSTLSAVALLLTIVSPHIHPAHWGVLPILGLVAPAIYVINIIFALYWIVRWRWRLALPTLALLIIGVGQVSLFLKVPLTKSYESVKKYGSAPKIMSYNVRGLFSDNGGWSNVNIAKYVEQERADIICFQEYNMDANKIDSIYSPRVSRYNIARYEDLMILSRYPILRHGNVFDKVDGDDVSISIWADVLIGRDTIRIFNNHLLSTTITARDDRYLTSTEIMQDNNRGTKIEMILSRYHNSCIERAKQVDVISAAIAASPYAVVVCGDFNDTPASYAYNVMSEGLQDAFRECGDDYSYTYRGFLNMLRIDYILTGEGVTPLSYNVDTEALYSDHLPITAHIRIRR